MGKPLQRYKFIYKTSFMDDHDYKKVLYASSTRLAWTKFNNYCAANNISLYDASIEELN